MVWGCAKGGKRDAMLVLFVRRSSSHLEDLLANVFDSTSSLYRLEVSD